MRSLGILALQGGEVQFSGFHTMGLAGGNRHDQGRDAEHNQEQVCNQQDFHERLFLPSCATEKRRDSFASVQLCNREQQLAGQTIAGYESFDPL